MFLIFGQLVLIFFVYLTLIFDLRIIFSKSLSVRFFLKKDSFLRVFFIRKNSETDPYLSFLLIPVLSTILLLILFVISYIIGVEVNHLYWILIIEIVLIGGFRLFIELLNKSYFKKEDKMTKSQFNEILKQYNTYFN